MRLRVCARETACVRVRMRVHAARPVTRRVEVDVGFSAVGEAKGRRNHLRKRKRRPPEKEEAATT
eukprot:4752546-Pleurochrysis_carterae.AAC.2